MKTVMVNGFCDFCDKDAHVAACYNGRGKIVAGICTTCAEKAVAVLAKDQERWRIIREVTKRKA
jgi:hypothetical protein